VPNFISDQYRYEMNRCLLVIVLLFSLNSLGAFAQGSATGCMIPSEQIVYPNSALKVLSNGNAIYLDTSPRSLDPNYCYWTPPSTASQCTVCAGLGACVLNICLCVGGQKSGYVGDFTMVECNLDGYSWTLGAAAGLFGVFVIRRRNKL